MATALLYGPGGDRLLGITWTWTAIGSILFILRAFTAAREPSKARPSLYGIRYDFIWAVLAYSTALVAQIATTVSLENAYSKGPMLDASSIVIRTGLIANILAIFSMTFGRFAVIALLLVLQGTAYVHWRKVLLAVGAAQAMANMVQIGFTLNQCSPVHKLWDLSAPGQCNNIEFNKTYGYFSGSLGAFCDFFLALYPAFLIIGPLQQMKLSLRIAICFILGGGAMAGIAGVTKTVLLGDVHSVQEDYATIITWTLTETWFILIFGTLTTVKPVFMAMGQHVRRLTGRLSGRSTRSGSRSWACEHANAPRSGRSGRSARFGVSALDTVFIGRSGPCVSDDEMALRTIASPSKSDYQVSCSEVEFYRQGSLTETERSPGP